MTAKIFKTEILVSLFKYRGFLVGQLAAKETFRDVGSAANRFKAVRTANAAAAKEQGD